MQVLALSSSRVGNEAYLASALPVINKFLGSGALQVAFVPFAAVDNDYEAYGAKVKEGLSSLPLTICTVTPEDGKNVIEQCDAVMIGGGNTFKLLHHIYQFDLFDLLQQKVHNGMPYIGWSAGANLAGQTICTTNDMPIIQPQSFTSFGFLPLQVNPHYHNRAVEGFNGETRDQRLTEFMLLHPGTPVVALPEGTALMLSGNQLQLAGDRPAFLFTNHQKHITPEKKEVLPGADISFLLR